MSGAANTTEDADASIKASVDGKLQRRLLPLLFLSALLCYVDRTNISFAARQMKKELSLSPRDYGVVAGVFFLSYSVCAVPGTLLVKRVGPHRGLAVVVLLWGFASGAMAMARSARELIALRLLLGAAQAPFFPSIVYYLTQWYTPGEMAVAYAKVRTATAVSGIIGGPLAGAIMHVSNWRWLFALEAVPAFIITIALLIALDADPSQARFLNTDERAWLLRHVRSLRPHEDTAGTDRLSARLSAAVRTRGLWTLVLVWLLYSCGYYGVIFWLPLLIGSSASSPLAVGLLSAVPYSAAVVSMLVVARSSDRTGERRAHIAGSATFGAVGFFCAAGVARFGGTATTPMLACLSAAAAGVWAMFGPFWAIPTGLFKGDAAAAGFALINSVGVLGGFVGPWLVGVIKERTGSYDEALAAFGGILLLSAAVSLCLAVNEGSGEGGVKAYLAVPSSDAEII